MAELAPHHAAWLSVHPHRSEGWLRSMLRDGFDVHHIDGDHANNDPENLVLIEHTDHMMLHGGRFLGRLGPPRPRKPRRYKRKTAIARYEATQAALVRDLRGED